ncbi:MAG: glycosyltransferase [Cellvibrionaceae bacterium]|nr:glycosyltransferase [Cellvibrionaceae bacterium]
MINIVYIQYNGNFSEIYKKIFIDNGSEVYYGQKYALTAKVNQAEQGNQVTAIQCFAEDRDEYLRENLRAIGMDKNTFSYQRLKKILASLKPDRVVINFPDAKILKYLRNNNIPTLITLADSFQTVSYYRIKTQLKNFLLTSELKKPFFKWIANHQINASESVFRLGIDDKKIIPYDWEHTSTPADWNKKIPADIDTKTLALFYAGGDQVSKGVYDLVRSLQHIKNSGRTVLLSIAGTINDKQLEEKIQQYQLSDSVKLLGRIDHDLILHAMNAADIVVVPSHHCYPEGLPMTIMEGLMVHTPVIASDHPMFVGRVGKEGACVQFFPEKDDRALAHKILTNCSDYTSYAELSKKAAAEWHTVTLNCKWADIVNTWIEAPDNCDFSEYSLHTYKQRKQQA